MARIIIKMYSMVMLTLLGSIAQCQDLAAHVSVSQSGSNWSYSLTNDENATSPNFLSELNLVVSAPFDNVTAPTGWSFTTDNSSYIFWFNTDSQQPYPHDVAPGLLLNGFSFRSSATESQLSSFGLSSWDHSQDAPGLTTTGMVLTPNVSSPVPEASTGQSMGALLLLGGLLAVRRLRVKRNGSRRVGSARQ